MGDDGELGGRLCGSVHAPDAEIAVRHARDVNAADAVDGHRARPAEPGELAEDPAVLAEEVIECSVDVVAGE